MAQVEQLWSEGRPVPMALAPVALWHLFETPQPIEDRPLPYSEEALGLEF